MENNKPQSINYIALIVSLFIVLLIGGVASYFTVPEIPGWYQTLRKPSFNPPRQLFGPVWTTLYVMIAIAAYLVWQRRTGNVLFNRTKWVYITQLALNFSWSIVFFGMHQVALALLVIALLWVTINFNIYYFSRFSKVAAWLLVPYLLWVSFASVLNLYIYLLNK